MSSTVPGSSALRPTRVPLGLLVLALVLLAALAFGCGSSGTQVCIEADGQTVCAASEARVAYECVREAGIELGPRDRIEPDYWAPVVHGTILRVVRVEELRETEVRAVPYGQRLVKTLGLKEGERRVLQSGREGTEEVDYLVVLEDGVQVSRRYARTRLVTPPQDEVVAVGMPQSGEQVEFDGTVAYLAQGNAWVMRGAARAQRPLTTSGDLDGRVFELSPDGRTLVYSRRAESTPGVLNALWAVTTEVVGAEPEDLGITGVLRARWSPDGGWLAYTGAESTEGSPGWRALNDIWVLDWHGDRTPRSVREAGCPGAYCWWGIELAWRGGEGLSLLVTDASSVLDVSADDGTQRILAEFEPLATGSDWVWVPELSPHPSGAHAVLAWPAAEEAGGFDLAVMDLSDGSIVRLIPGVGMWARPRCAPPGSEETRMAYAVADDGPASASSPYTLWVADADGSETRRVYPAVRAGSVIYEFAWSTDGHLLVGAEDGLYLCGANTGEVRPLLDGLPVTRVQWAGLAE